MLRRIKRNLVKELYAALYPFRRKSCCSKTIVACIFSVGERTEEDAVNSVKGQTFPVTRIELIKNIAPISKALNRVFDIASDADYVLLVDADMILYNYCLDALLRFARKDVLYSVGELTDPVMGNIGHVKLLNMALAKSSGLRYREVLGSDFDLIKQAERLGSGIIPMCGSSMKKILGIHHPTYTAKELFRKMQIWRKKRGNRTDKELLTSLVRKYRESDNRLLLYGILGLIISNPDKSSGESYPESGLDNWEAAQQLFGKIDEDEVYGYPEFIRKK
jgi:hypothetical protein